MKKLIRSDGVQAVLGLILGGYLRLVLWTVRWRHENQNCVEPALAGPTGVIGLIWHGRFPLSLATAPVWWRKQTKCMVSPSADGEFFARALAMNGFRSIRASSAKKGNAAKARQAVGALREAVAWVAGGHGLVTSPDGPLGAREVIAPGMIQIARRTGAPVFLTGLAAKPAWRAMGSWDQAMFALPFGRGAAVWEGPLYVPAGAKDAEIAAIIQDWSARLSALTRRAEALVGWPAD